MFVIQAASSLPTDVSALESSISALESAISALEGEIRALERSTLPWEYGVWLCTFLVVVGVAMEFWVILHERNDDMGAWLIYSRFGVIRPPGRPATTKFIFELVSVFLITVGVTGELGIGIEIDSINGNIRGMSAELRSKNSELPNISDRLVALINDRTADAELETERLRKELAWRHLSSQQRADLVHHVGQFPGQRYEILIPDEVGETDDPEITDFANSLEDSLGVAKRYVKGAGWIERARANVAVGVPGGVHKEFAGIEVSISKASKPGVLRAGEALVSWLKSQDLAAKENLCFHETCHEWDSKEDFDNVLIVVIGRKL